MIKLCLLHTRTWPYCVNFSQDMSYSEIRYLGEARYISRIPSLTLSHNRMQVVAEARDQSQHSLADKCNSLALVLADPELGPGKNRVKLCAYRCNMRPS